MYQRKNFISLLPANPKIKNCIAYYYFQSKNPDNKTEKVLYYPHYYNAINFYKNGSVVWDNCGRTVTEDGKNQITCLVTCNVHRARTVSLIGDVQKIGIVLRPLGLNHFIHGITLADISKEAVSEFTYFGESFISLAKSLYASDSTNQKVDLLDTYFLERYKPFADGQFKDCVESIVEAGFEIPLAQLALTQGLSQKAIYRKFKKHLCCSPRQFKNVLRFRSALHSYQRQHPKKTITSVALEYYYDQSDFIKHYKAFSGLTPKASFDSIIQWGSLETFWTAEK